jgi:RNA polymerase sigma-70 factor (ECF subfamily)
MSFPTTRWTFILDAQEDTQARQDAMRQILGAYWRPLYLYARRLGRDLTAAEDAVQGFLAHLLDQDVIAKLDRNRGRLRSYMKSAFRNYLGRQAEKAAALRRGGAFQAVPLDFDFAENSLMDAPEQPDAAFDREWALQVMAQGLRRLEQEYREGGRAGPFEVVEQLFRFGELPPLQQVAEEHGMTVSQTKSFLSRARKRYREILLEEVAGTVVSPEDVDAELDELISALG